MFKSISSFIFGDPIDRLFHALNMGRTEELYRFINSGGDPNASVRGYGADKNGRMSLIRLMAAHHRVREVEFLLDKGADPRGGDNSLNGTSLLHTLADSTNEENVRAMRKALELGLDPEGSERASATPLYIAASRGNKALVSLLLEFGADPNRTNWGGVTPLEVLGQYRNGMKCIRRRF